MPLIAYDLNPRCHCGKLLAERVTWPWRIRCVRCKTVVTHETQPGPSNALIEWVEDTPRPT